MAGARVTGYTAEQQVRLGELAERKRRLDERAAVVIMQTKQAMREAGEPVREDFASRAAYRAAVARFRRGRTN